MSVLPLDKPAVEYLVYDKDTKNQYVTLFKWAKGCQLRNGVTKRINIVAGTLLQTHLVFVCKRKDDKGPECLGPLGRDQDADIIADDYDVPNMTLIDIRKCQKFITVNSFNLLSRASGADIVPDTLISNLVVYERTEQLKVYGKIILDQVNGPWMSTDNARGSKYKYTVSPKSSATVDMLALLTPLYHLPNFCGFYQDYENDMDSETVIDTNLDMVNSEYNFGSHFESDLLIEPVGYTFRMTKDQWTAIGFLILFCFTKSGEVANLGQAFEKRLATLKNAAKLRIDVKEVMSRIDIASFAKIQSFISDYPKLKTAIIQQIIANKDAVSTNACNIMRESNLSSFLAIVKFISAEFVTALHFDIDVVPEYTAFKKKQELLEARYGAETWTYYKLICPDDQTASTADVPQLVNAAKAWCISHGLPTLANLKTKNQIPKRFEVKAMRTLPLIYQKRFVDLNDFKAMISNCGLNIDLSALGEEQWTELLGLATEPYKEEKDKK